MNRTFATAEEVADLMDGRLARTQPVLGQWFVAVDQSYYPWVHYFDSQQDARSAYEEATKNYYVDHVAVYLGVVYERTDFRQENLGWQPIVEDDPERDGYCDWCRPK